jgi:hypothetical protein
LNELTDFHEIWYECYVFGDHSNLLGRNHTKATSNKQQAIHDVTCAFAPKQSSSLKMLVNEVVTAYHVLQKMQNRKRKCLWVNSFYINIIDHSVYVVARNLSADQELFQSYY